MWITINRNETTRGRDEASDTNKFFNSQDLINKLDIGNTFPELAIAKYSSKSEVLIETIATYKNNDWIREKNKLGEFVLPPRLAYQYKNLKDLESAVDISSEIYHYAISSRSMDEILIPNEKMLYAWPEKRSVEIWRQVGLHNLLREFMSNEINRYEKDTGSLDYGTIDGSELVNISLSNETKTKLLDICNSEFVKKLDYAFGDALYTVINRIVVFVILTALGSVSLDMSPQIRSTAFAATGTTFTASIGNRIVYLLLNRYRWDRFVDFIEPFLLNKFDAPAYASAFGGVRILGFGKDVKRK